MDLLFIGGLFPKHLESEIIENSKGEIQFAANNLQWAIINGFDQLDVKTVQLCNIMFIGAFPTGDKKICIRTEKFSRKPGLNDTNYGFFNLIGFSFFFRFCASIKGLVTWIPKESEEKVIIIYAMHTPFLLTAYFSKLFYKKVKLCLIAPDLPEYTSDRKNTIYKTLKSIDKQFIKFLLRKIDAFVFLTAFMRERLDIGGRPWICIEGIYDNSLVDHRTISKSKSRVILYAGSLAARYGIINLLDAFSRIEKENYELWICGDGDSKEEIINRLKGDPRIKYYGTLPRERVLDMQQRATVLVNPRTSEGEFTRFSFPSKVMEYFASGTPTIIHRLPGIPEEYFSYCFVAEQEDSEGLYKAIAKTCEMDQDELNEIGKKARRFILEQKNPKIQVHKILNLISSI